MFNISIKLIDLFSFFDISTKLIDFYTLEFLARMKYIATFIPTKENKQIVDDFLKKKIRNELKIYNFDEEKIVNLFLENLNILSEKEKSYLYVYNHSIIFEIILNSQFKEKDLDKINPLKRKIPINFFTIKSLTERTKKRLLKITICLIIFFLIIFIFVFKVKFFIDGK